MPLALLPASNSATASLSRSLVAVRLAILRSPLIHQQSTVAAITVAIKAYRAGGIESKDAQASCIHGLISIRPAE